MYGASHSMEASSSRSPAASRAFLGLLNPIGRQYHGYEAASLLEEDENSELQTPHQMSNIASTSKSHVSWTLKNTSNTAKDNDDKSSDDEVPQSLMFEVATRSKPSRRSPSQPPRSSRSSKPKSSFANPPKPSILPTTHPIHPSIPHKPSEAEAGSSSPARRSGQTSIRRGLDGYEKALWNWINVYNIDVFLQDVYSYYEGGGIFCIALSRGLNLLTVGFVISFSTFILGCVDYSRLRHDRHEVNRLADIMIGRCITKFSGFTLLFFLCFGTFYIWQLIQFIFHVRRLIDMYRFYTYLLGIPDPDIQTISWPEIVRRIGAIRDQNPATALSSTAESNPGFSPLTAKLDAHDVANRIMRKENYLIALFNKELLDLRSPIPKFVARLLNTHGGGSIHGEGKSETLTQALEWNLRFCLMEWLFDKSGRVNRAFLNQRNRKVLIDHLRRRFIFMGIINAIAVPFIVPYILIHSFFRYFEEYHKNPSSLSGRKYTLLAEWKFREFNELPHYFARRLAESHPAASMYIGQFPNEKIAILMRFVAFVAGSFAAVLLLASVVDPDLFLGLEITPHRTVLFYIGVFGSILAVARGMIPEENRVFDPEMLMTEVIHYTHYMPEEWNEKLHSQSVHKMFGKLFQMKVVIFVQELLSVVLTPFILWYSLPPCAPAIVDFFREFSLHVDGLDYVCSFAVFDFQRHGNIKYGAPAEPNEVRFMSKEGKMEKSFLNFKAANPQWNPTDPTGSLYLARMADHGSEFSPHLFQRRPGIPGLHHHRFKDKDTFIAARAQEYDIAFQRSMARAKHKRTVTSTQGDDDPTPVQSRSFSTAMRDDNRGFEGGIDSELGDSYVDDIKILKGGKPFVPLASERHGEDILEDGGVMGLLAQIYEKGRPVL